MVEIAFIDNTSDMSIFERHKTAMAQEFVQAITGQTLKLEEVTRTTTAIPTSVASRVVASALSKVGQKVKILLNKGAITIEEFELFRQLMLEKYKPFISQLST